MEKLPPKSPNYYPLQAGNEWRFQASGNGKEITMIFRVSKIENIDGQKLARVETLVEGDIVAAEHLQRTEKGILRHRFNAAEVTPPFVLLKLPAKAGDKWNGEIKIGDVLVSYQCETGQEEVQVPAGKFKTMRVSVSVEEKGQILRTTYWFAAETGMVKQVVDLGKINVTLELQRFTRGK